MLRSFLVTLLAALLVITMFSGCRQIRPKPTQDITENTVFTTEPLVQKPLIKKPDLASAAEIEALSKGDFHEYLIGEGDMLSLEVWKRPEVSAANLMVSPDGYITIPRVGTIHIINKTRDEVARTIQKKLDTIYANSELTLTITRYGNNRAYVLGKVVQPGIVHFPGRGSLIEAISLAGGIPSLGDNQSYHTECAIIRGNKQIIWIDLNDLLNNGNMALNAAIQNDDVIFVPAVKQALAYIMGAVARPGALTLSHNMTLMDALMQSGGPTEEANLKKTFLIRWDGEKSFVREIDLRTIIAQGNFQEDYVLKDKDVIFVGELGVSSWNSVIRKITPTFRLINLTDNAFGTVDSAIGD